MAMPKTTRMVNDTRLTSLDASGTLKLGGCLPLIVPSHHHIVIVDPNATSLTNLSKELTVLGYTVTSLSNLATATDVIIENLVDLVICSDTMTGSNRGWYMTLRNMIEEKMILQDIQRYV